MEAISQGTASTVEDYGLVFKEDFEAVLDVPFMTLNRIGAEWIGEVILSGTDAIDHGRVQAVLDTAAEHGQHIYARKHSMHEGESIMLFFTSNESGLGHS